ncbi:MAG TPA: iron export ABC transporter permease subunit FetB [Candidatus Marinimicrobia bacterium]|nr:iron export ABC transporter permease subunit FetB [Candidatus Neomarinimicrobiota bacterium]
MNTFDPSTISFGDLFLSLLLIVLVLAIVGFLKLPLIKPLLMGTVRSFLQLILLGYALQYLFALNSAWQIALLFLLMIFYASWEGKRRQKIAIPGYWRLQVLTLSISLGLIMATVLLIILDLEPWFNPVLVIPVGGMIIGQALNGSSVMSNNLANYFQKQQLEVETLLSLGASRYQAALPLIREAVRTAMIPNINALNTVGLISIPGVLVGAVLGGVDPLTAIKYQILVMYFWTATTTLSCAILAFLISGVFINHHHQLQRNLFYKLRSS